MDNDAENVEENEKYSFLLASAIRNEDPEQFFSIYDSILPKNLPDIQVELIKSRAREIADFPEDEFSSLVLRARNFSLANNRNKMSYDVTATGMYKTEDKPSSEDNDDDLDGVQLRPHGGCCPMTYQSSPFSRHQESCIIDMEQVDKRTDNDSGICNSSKATTSIGSYSDQDSDGDDRGCFDYYPSSTVKITTPTTTYHLDYDEAHEVDSDRNDIESPRSGKGSDSEPTFQGVQMKTYSRRTVPNHDDDFETDDDSDNDSRILHQRLYGRERRKRNINYYTPMTHERYEEYDNTSTSTFSFEKSQMALKDRSGSSLRDVDEPINFPMYSRHSNYRGSTSSDRVRIEKNSYRRDGYGNDPPFGQGLDQLNKVGSSIGELISSTKHTVDGMPEGRPISQSLDLAAEDGKKKKKKKRGSKDDLEDKSKRRADYSDTDENGNPRLECAPLLAGHYKHMREPPIKSSNPLNDPMRFRQTSYGTNTRDLEESTSNQEGAKKPRKKQKKDKTVETVRRAEEIENYQGRKEIDEILSFIENDCTGRKPRKVPNNNTVDISSSKATDKNNKKNKERKPKVTPVDLKPTEKKDSQSENKDFTEESPENSETSNSNSEMGNSTEKISTEEIVTTDCQKNIKEQNHIIAEKCVDKDSKMEEEMMNGDVISCEEEDAIGSSIRKPMEPKVGKEFGLTINHQVERKSLDIIDNTDEVIKDPKIDTSLNNVKHNNMKNSKRKQTSTVSDNNKKDIDKTYLVKEPENLTDEEKMEVKSNIVVDSDEMEKEGDYYIFTDLDLPKPVEEEFQVVGKKKKKGGPVTAKETQSKEASAAQRVPIREERRRPQRSITPPPSSIVTSLSMEAERNKMRDLSPSSFPALGAGRQGRQSFRDGRRSSTGDVPKEILIKPQDDSDLESVKSLPASAQAVSPRLQISYAKMAASPKPNCSVSTFHSDDPEDQSNVSVDLKSAVWKGSHTERRHSIGSSPDGKDNEAPSIRQKFGSQELVKLEKEENLFSSSQLPSSPEKSPSGIEASRSNSFQSSSVDNSAAVDSVSNTVLNTSVTKASDSEFNEPLESYSINITAHVMAKTNGANNQVSSKSHVTKSSSCEPSKPSKLQVSSKQKGIARRQARSVVFLDRSEKDHKNLDIQFGFDPQLDHEELKVSVSNSVSSSSLQSSVLSQTKSSESVCGDNSKEFPPIPVIHSKSVSNNSSSTNTKDFKHSPRNSKSASFPLEGKNGVKSMSTLIFSSDSKNPSGQMFSFMSEDTCAPAVSDSSVISTPTASSVEGCVTVIYGEECGAVLGAESKPPSGGQLKYRRETGDILGCFNRIEVTNYLIREWENVMNMKDKNPERILFYNQH